jgi:1,4-alpha-glucan branching enzyme
VLVICNFTPVPHQHWQLGVPQSGLWRECLNTDASIYGGTGLHNPPMHSYPEAYQGHPHSIWMTVPPLATVMLVREADVETSPGTEMGPLL